MKKYDVIVLGFGKGGKTLAAKLANQGKKVAIVEKNPMMYGGTCINIGCIPTKVLIQSVKTGHDFTQAMAQKEEVVTKLRAKNFKMLDDNPMVDVYTAEAHFIANKVIELSVSDERLKLEAEIIIINTGAISNQLPIKGLAESKFVYDSTGIQQLTQQPKRLGVIGGGNIGLEFANLYANLGSDVTVFDPIDRIFAREENEVSILAQNYLEAQGISFELGTQIEEIQDKEDKVVIKTANKVFECDAILYATGRKPNTADIGLNHTDIQIDSRGAVLVDDYCQTTVENVFAVGDVNGGPQFTYISLDDSRIVFNYLNGDTSYCRANRHHVPTTTFINPPLSRVGLDEASAKEQGKNYKVNRLDVANMPRGHVNNDLRGFFKVVIDVETEMILGATLFGAQSEELINLITMAMDNHIPYHYFKKQIFTHPTMAENFNDLFNF